jgi:hypothetical protein
MAAKNRKHLAIGLAALALVGTFVGVAAASGGRGKGDSDDDDDDDDDANPPNVAPLSPSPSGITIDPEGEGDLTSPGWPQAGGAMPTSPPGPPPAVVIPPLTPGGGTTGGSGATGDWEPGNIINTGGGAVPLPDLGLPPNVVIPESIPINLPSVSPGIVPPPAVVQPAPSPTVDTVGMQLTNAMVTELKNAERATGWKRPFESVAAWQTHFGRVVDSKFGPNDGLFLATLTGNVPVVRYWPAKDGTNPKAALNSYKAGLSQIAAAKTGVHAAELRASIARERGQSFGPPTGNNGQVPIV